jgi:hypothetical protein
MKKIIQIILIGFCLLSLLILCLFVRQKYQTFLLHKAQLSLGNQLGVDAEKYSKIFPDDYFYAKLNTNMDIADVHKIVLGYKKAYNCGSNLELYLFFNADPDKAIRFGIIYDERNRMKFERVEYTDQNSGYPNIISYCKEGLLPDNN